MIFGSVCSGIEAASVAWEPLGWQAAWLSEIEKFSCAVLENQYPFTPNLGDMTKLYENKIFQETRIDLLVGGTPCQSFSVAGLRKGLDDPRGNLALEFLRLINIKRPKWFVWENVPGVLSSNRGKDFGSFLGAIHELGYGFAYRILDAQYFGVPQRRRRVFVVGYIGDWCPPSAVLFESESLSGNFETGRKKRKGVAPTISARTKGGGGLGTDFDLDGGLITSTGEIAHCLNAGADAGDKAPTLRAGGHTKSHANAGVMPTVCITGTKTHALKADEFDGSEDGTGRGQPLIAVGVSLRGRDGGATAEITEGAAPALRASQGGGDKPHVLFKSCVRRLTPVECERLQGFPDNYTLIPTGKRAADGPRYKALGNSMAVPVMHWIGQRIQMVENMGII